MGAWKAHLWTLLEGPVAQGYLGIHVCHVRAGDLWPIGILDL